MGGPVAAHQYHQLGDLRADESIWRRSALKGKAWEPTHHVDKWIASARTWPVKQNSSASIEAHIVASDVEMYKGLTFQLCSAGCGNQGGKGPLKPAHRGQL